MIPKVNYLTVKKIISAQRKAVFDKIKQQTQSTQIYPGLTFKQTGKPLDLSTIPGLQEAGWNPSMAQAFEKGPPKQRGPFYILMKKIVSEMQEHASAWPFLVPVSGVPDYYNVIKEPMDLKTLDEHIEDEKYATLESFQRDVNLIFSNCKSYNEDGTTYVKCANRLERWFKDRFRQLKAEQRL